LSVTIRKCKWGKNKNLQSKLLRELSSYTTIPEEGTTYSTHGIHPYTAKFIPQIPARIIEECSNERHTVLDPFCGSGTTLLEAYLKGRNSIGFDVNPIAYLISRVKTTRLLKEDWADVQSALAEIKSKFANKDYSEIWIPQIPRIDHWFQEGIIQDLGLVAGELKKIENHRAKNFLELVLSSMIVLVSKQESETRYAAVDKTYQKNMVETLFFNKATNMSEKVNSLSFFPKTANTKCTVFLADAKKMTEFVAKRSADLVITSPPYLNSYDYYLYHKFRMYWLGFDRELAAVNTVREMELGSRAEYSGKKGKPISKFRSDMTDALIEVARITKLGKLIFILVGDSIVRNQFIEMDKFYEQICKDIGIEFVAKTSYPLEKVSRSFVSQRLQASGSFKKMQHILIFRNRKHRSTSSIKPRIKSEENPNDIVVKRIPKNVINGTTLFISNNKVAEYTHGLVKYPSKFIPDIPRWAINNFSKKGDRILDPFVGVGTTLVEARLASRNSVGLDINPFAVLASNVKSNPIEGTLLWNSLEKILERANKGVNVALPDFPLREFWFNREILGRIMLLRSAILLEEEPLIRDFFLLILSNIIKPCSYWDESQIKIERDQRKIFRGVPDPIFLFRKKAVPAIKAMNQFYEDATQNVTTFAAICDSTRIPKYVKHRNEKYEMKNFDVVVTSPPYINAINYPMFNRFEIFILDLINPNSYIDHQKKYLGTERVYAHEYKQFGDFLGKKKKFQELNEKIRTINKREPKRAYIVKRYFDGMMKATEEIHRLLKKNGKFVLVAGSNTIRGVHLPTYEIIQKCAEEVGFSTINLFSYRIRRHRFKITRHRTGKKIRIDNIVVMERS
jgi:DNA modification methylase